MASQEFDFHSSTYTNDPPDSSHEEPSTGVYSTLNGLPMLSNVNGISFPLYHGKSVETMQDERRVSTNIGHSTFQNSYVVRSYSPPGQSLLHLSVRKDPNLSGFQDWFASNDGRSDDTSRTSSDRTLYNFFPFGDLDVSIGAENPSILGNYSMGTTYLEYTDVAASDIQALQYDSPLRPTGVGFETWYHPTGYSHAICSNPYLLDVQERSAFDDGRDDALFSSFPPSDLDSMGTEKPSVQGNDLMQATNWAPDLYSRTDHNLEGDNAKALQAFLGSLPPVDNASPLAFGTTNSCLPSFDHGLLKPCPKGYTEGLVGIQKGRGGPLSLLPGPFVYYVRDSLATLYSCPVDGCTSQFSGNEIRTHLRTEHPDQPSLQCMECGPEASLIATKNYASHVLDVHSGYSIRCGYCLAPQSRVKNLPRHLVNHCSALKQYMKNWRAAAQPPTMANTPLHTVSPHF
ncbi:hypothetical protein IW261DRAFT_1521335 [Armillaria novae-zelandiae]|uniref:C2H2-type domain-containing protein n=1 Tax=Armillaria novae-zelandiae TaxID=153914 RepID=A0AA39TU84_9AGAR|nr:hypothetical protein IW261DRAFT_1521335 [Armillaria novae-zelandiae]